MSPYDYKEQRLSRFEARKLVVRIVNQHPENIYFSKHALQELANDGLSTVDALNVLKSSDAQILSEGEFISGSYRYRLETSNLMVVVGFWCDGRGFNVITAWDKRKRGVQK